MFTNASRLRREMGEVARLLLRPSPGARRRYPLVLGVELPALIGTLLWGAVVWVAAIKLLIMALRHL